MPDKIQKSIEEYKRKLPIYESLTDKTDQLVKEILIYEGLNFQSVTSRTKGLLSFTKKAQHEKYSDPISEIYDISGIRIILYTEGDARKVFQILLKSFDIIPEHTIDKSVELGVDRFGYRSLHCVGRYTPERLSLPEFSIFKDLCFEIQVRTILQHAWAEFEHDRNYKFSGVLPQDFKRRLSILAGLLELTDKEFDKISIDIDNYTKEVSEKTEKGILDIELTTISISDYMKNKFEILISKNLLDYDLTVSEDVIHHLKQLGITNLQNLENIIPKDYIAKVIPIAEALQGDPKIYTLNGILFDIMTIHDAKEFFENREIPPLAEEEILLYESYGVNKQIIKKMRSM